MTQSPRILINFAVLATALFAFAMIAVLRTMPYTGFTLEFDEGSQSMQIVRLDSWVESQGFQLGDGIASIENADGLSIEIERKHILRSSSEARRYYENRSARLTEIDRMHELLSNGPLRVSKSNGSTRELILDRARPLSSLSLEFWILFTIALTSWLSAAIVWAWQPKQPETILLLLSGIGFAFTCFSSVTSINNNEMLYIPLFLHWFVRFGQDVGQHMFTVFGTAVLLYYPNRLPYAKNLLIILILAFLLYPFFAVFNSWSWGELAQGIYPYFSDAESYVPMFLVFSLTIFLCWEQYRRSKNHPVQRAQTLWLILAWTLGPGIFLMLYVLPRWLGEGAIVSGSIFLNLTILTTFLMVLVGIARINLFQLEQHIGQAYQWVLIAFVVIGFDIALISFINLSPEVSSGILLIAILWAYIPLRQWIQNRLSAGSKNRNQALTSEAVVLMVQNSLDAKTLASNSWKQVVRSLFLPGHIAQTDSDEDSKIVARGQSLLIGQNEYSPALKLDFAEGGSRLFVKKDIELAKTLSVLFEKLYDVRDAFLAGQNQERSRIRRDLHDQIGHKLLSLIYAAEDEKSKSLAQETMAQLSELIQAMKQEPIPLNELAARAHRVCEEICANANLQLSWDNSIAEEAVAPISSDQFLNILNMLRELLSNTIKHAQANRVEVELLLDHNSLVLSYSDDGKGFDQEKVKPGNGLFNLQSRAEELSARMDWATTQGTFFKLTIPVKGENAIHG